MSIELVPRGDRAGAPSSATTPAYAASIIAKAAPGTGYYVTGHHSGLAAKFIQIHDAAALPADGSAPSIILLAAAASNFSFYFGTFGRYFSNGIVVCNSSTGPTKTIGAADCWIDVGYA